jgi:drug/metabolite transporter (DMT)-like permease
MTSLPTSLRLRATLLAIFVTVLWSTSWVLIKIGLRGDLPPVTFAGLRYTLAFLCLAPFVLLNPTQRQAVKALTRSDWLKLSLLGLIFYTFTQGSMFLSLKYLPANMVSLLLNLTSVFVAIGGIFLLRERPSPFQWLGILLAFTGVCLYFLPVNLPHAQVVGVAIGLTCMGLNVISTLFNREVNRHALLSPLVVTFISMGIGSLLMLLVGLLMEDAGRLTGQDWLIIAWLAVVNTALAFTLWNHSLQVLTAIESSILNGLMMPQIALLAYFFLGENLSTRALIGLGLVGIGTIIVHLKPRKNM